MRLLETPLPPRAANVLVPVAAAAGWCVLALLAASAVVRSIEPLFRSDGEFAFVHALLTNAVALALTALAFMALAGRPLTSQLLSVALYSTAVAVSTVKLDQLGLPPLQQPVPYLIRDTRSDVARLEHTRSWILPALLLEAAGIEPDAYSALVTARRHGGSLLAREDSALPEPRFAEPARLCVRDEFDTDIFAGAGATQVDASVGPMDAAPVPEVEASAPPLPDIADGSASPAAN